MTLQGREAHHGLHVLRLQRGERVTVLDGAGHEYLCELMDSGRDKIRLAVKQKNAIPAPPYQVTLLQAIAKGKAMETIVQKATELGTHRLVPIISERVVTHLDSDTAEGKAEKWELTAIEAIKQSGSAWLPRIEKPVSLNEFISRGEKFELPLVAALQNDARHPRELFTAFLAEQHRLPQTICIWVGPEGDFTPAEMAEIRSAGARPITLGRLILRSETAALYCLSILNYELQSPRLEQNAEGLA